MNIVEHASILNESFRVTNVPKQYVIVERLRNGEVISMKRFELGDQAEYDSYNMRYVGTIVAIGAKTITIKEKYHDGRNHRLDTRSFAFRNWDFDALEIAEHNWIATMNT